MKFNVHLSPHIIVDVVAATNHWLTTTAAGQDFAEKSFKLLFKDAHDGFKFKYRGKSISSKKIKQVTGYIVDGIPVEPGDVSFEKNNDIPRCEGCGEPCVHGVSVSNGSKYEQYLCSHCLQLDDWARFNVDIIDCDTCTFDLCDHHPSNRLKVVGGS